MSVDVLELSQVGVDRQQGRDVVDQGLDLGEIQIGRVDRGDVRSQEIDSVGGSRHTVDLGQVSRDVLHIFEVLGDVLDHLVGGADRLIDQRRLGDARIGERLECH
ncbi:MAG: hypothetical protein EOQ44_25290 [Mesorhizobium sp.]|uniref:hypothetical protein n=1 Tax=Mesorhizobium sp. TaxID=1871066 RepID=UPI000FE60108|nr:hypothetical protein [Mesorhizobium sp.]RWB40458.1 MAG: hypothetical protein EOQ44_25290 [Mesorhizobium sp.]